MKQCLFIFILLATLAKAEETVQETVEVTDGGEEILDTVEVTENPGDDSFSGFWEENKGTQIFSGKKNTITNLELIPKLPINNYRQAMAQTPGLLISEVPNESLAAITFRGLGDPHESYNVLLLQDGIPVAADMYGYPAHYYAPPLAMMEKFQFIRGGAALHYGPQPGGVVNYISYPLEKNQPTAGRVSVAAGSYELLTTNNAIFGSKGDHAYAIEYYRRQGEGLQRINSDFEADYVLLRDNIYKGNTIYRIDFNGYNSDHGEPGGHSKIGGTDLNLFGDDARRASKRHDRLKVSRAQLVLGADHRINDSSMFEVNLWAGAYNRYSKRQDQGTAPAFGGIYNGSFNTITTQKFYTYNGETRYLKDYKAFGNDHTFSAGYLWYNIISPLTEERGDRPDANSGTVRKRIDRETHVNSVYAENRFSFGRFMVTPGIRVENIQQEIEERKLTPATTLRDRDTTDNVPLLGLGMSYLVSDNTQVYGNISEAYKPLTWSDAIPSKPTETVAGDIEASKVLNYELGYRGETAPVNWDVSVFYIRYENKIALVGNEFRNSGAGTHKGVDAAVEVKLSNIYEKLRTMGDFRFFANTAYLHARYTQGSLEGNIPQYAPQMLTRTGIIYGQEDFLKVAFMGVMVSRHFGDDNNGNTGGNENFEIPSYTVFDLTSDWNFHKNWMLSGGINNIFNTEYFSRVRSDGVAWALPRNYYAGVTYKF